MPSPTILFDHLDGARESSSRQDGLYVDPKTFHAVLPDPDAEIANLAKLRVSAVQDAFVDSRPSGYISKAVGTRQTGVDLNSTLNNGHRHHHHWYDSDDNDKDNQQMPESESNGDPPACPLQTLCTPTSPASGSEGTSTAPQDPSITPAGTPNYTGDSPSTSLSSSTDSFSDYASQITPSLPNETSSSSTPSGSDLPASASSASKSGPNAGAIAGGVIGGVIFLAILALAFIFLRKRRQRSRMAPSTEFLRSAAGSRLAGGTNATSTGDENGAPPPFTQGAYTFNTNEKMPV